MKILTLHCDYIKYKAVKKALKNVEKIDNKQVEVNEPLVVLMAVEKGDSQETLIPLIDSIKKTAKDVKAKNIVLYPYAHLSSSLASPDLALKLLKDLDSALSKSLKVTRAPFGYYKQFELKCKGHPLAELSKEFKTSSLESYNEKTLLRELSRTKLDTSKLKDNDHRIIGQNLDLFSFNESAPGAVFWHHNGLIIYNQLVSFLKTLLNKYEYKEISTPAILDNKLWKVSGHWDHFKDNMFISSYEGRDFGVKPMNCPGSMLIYKSKTRSYKDLPLRFAEFGVVHRKELSGVLAGLFRVVKFTQDDAHVFCTHKDVEKEIAHMLELVKILYKDTFNFQYSVELSTRPKKFLGNESDWDSSEKALQDALKKSKIKFKINKGDGAFYGPKIDIHIKDSLNRAWQLGTIQLDMQMPKRFQLEYTGKDNKQHTPIVIHRAIFGSLERFIGILLEHLSGNLPLWISPIQVRVLSFTDRNKKAAQSLLTKLQDSGIRADIDIDSSGISEKVRNAELQKIPYILTIGDKEEKSKTIAVRNQGKTKFGIRLPALIKEFQDNIEKRI